MGGGRERKAREGQNGPSGAGCVNQREGQRSDGGGDGTRGEREK